MLVWSYWPDHEGGAERQCRKLVHSLCKMGVQPTVVTSRLNRKIDRVTMDGGCRVVRLGPLCLLIPFAQSLVGPLHRLFASDVVYRSVAFWLMLPVMWLARLSFILAACRFFRREGFSFDVIHVHESGWLAGVGVWLGQSRGLPVMAKEAIFPALLPVGYDVPHRGKWNNLRRAAYFIAMAEYIVVDLRKQGIKDDKILMLPNGVPVPDEKADVERYRDVLFVGNFSQGVMHKAFDVLIDAWAIVHKQMSDVTITLAGSGEAMRWQQRAELAGCKDSMIWAGWVPDTSSLLRKAGIFVLPSRMEGLSNALLEAQSWGLACVVSDIPGNLALVEHNVNGLVVPAGDARALADALIRLIEDRSLRVRLGSEARRKMASDYAMDHVTQRFVETYRQLVEAGSGRGGEDSA